MSLMRSLIASQVSACKWIEMHFFSAMSARGNATFLILADEAVGGGKKVADIGGGKTPMFPASEVKSRSLEVVAVDIDENELNLAPSGSYVQTFVGPIEQVRGDSTCDIVVAQSVLEHVYDGRLAAQGISSFLKPGGMVYTFCPCRRAWFARLNLLLPEKLKRLILFSIFPEKRERQGFPAYYSGCTPAEMRLNMANAGVECVEVKYFFTSSYFMFFVPLYLIWRLATFPFMRLWPDRYCETFIFIGRKNQGNAS